MNYNKIEKIINYTFNNKEHLKTALTHSSYAYQNNVQSYEVYEFLGDALLNFFVSEYLFLNFKLSEGQFTKLRANIVNAKSLKNIIANLDIKNEILMGRSTGNKVPASVLSDIFESLTAAIYLDNGLNSAKKFVNNYLIINQENIKKHYAIIVDFKSILQEKMQAENKKIKYKVLKKSGSAHDMCFTVGLFINGKNMVKASAKSIKLAEKKCAQILLETTNNK